ncbi:flagellar motor switch phosphatase FliY [Pueribacillus theae]|uniref:Flagellar motor switch phosphatase FliY n=1 Tax=Pueribacillus theae TaxID=2171751 RepID=A0A2U1K8E5_9BACI|nr:flagellar motor switch phosphatase FliY [Pueribacillus theae]PWA13513.1 flagellar motor switch phosphatase FliY [Pueribacillus theae]
MTDGMLSQEEIDALLNGGETSDSAGSSEDGRVSLDQYLNVIEQDALGEIGNISFGNASTALSMLLNQKVDITTPVLSLIFRSELAAEFPHPHVAINVKYTEGFKGENVMVIQEKDAQIIADLMLGGDGTNVSDESLTDIQLSAVQEAMNQMMGSASTSMSTIFNKKVDISPPSIEKLNAKQGEGTDQIPQDEYLVKVSFALKVGDLIDSKIMQIVPIPFAKEMVKELLDLQAAELGDDAEVDEEPTTAPEPPIQNEEKKTIADMPEHTNHLNHFTERAKNIQPAAFSDFGELTKSAHEPNNLDLLLDIPLQVTVELGRTSRAIKDILDLSTGSIIELDKLAGEPVDILVNKKLIAKGEVVVIDENFGVRVTDIISQKDRIRNLQ